MTDLRPQRVDDPAAVVDTGALRRAVLAVSVLQDVDLDPADDGVRLRGRSGGVVLTWAALSQAVGPHPAVGEVGLTRLGTYLRLHKLVADLGSDAADLLAGRARALALPADHALHPGSGWLQEDLLGGALGLGVAVEGLLGDPDAVVPLPADVAAAAGADTRAWWPAVREHAERMGALAARRLALEPPRSPGRAVLRPVGGCDVPTLLASSVLRAHLTGQDGSGLRAVAAPMRSRGWYDLSRVDPAFVLAAWSATEPSDRGVARPLLVTADEVAPAASGGDPAGVVTSEAAAAATGRGAVHHVRR